MPTITRTACKFVDVKGEMDFIISSRPILNRCQFAVSYKPAYIGHKTKLDIPSSGMVQAGVK